MHHFFILQTYEIMARRGPITNPSAMMSTIQVANQLSGSTGATAFPSRPGNALATARSGGDGRRAATRSHAQRAVAREHGEDGEHRTFSDVSTVAHSTRVGGPAHQHTTRHSA